MFKLPHGRIRRSVDNVLRRFGRRAILDTPGAETLPLVVRDREFYAYH